MRIARIAPECHAGFSRRPSISDGRERNLLADVARLRARISSGPDLHPLETARMQRFYAIGTLAVLLSIACPPVSAAEADGASLAAAVVKAAATVSSFRMTLSGAQNISSTIVVVRPDRVKIDMSFGPSKTQSVVIGSTSYVRVNGGTWLVSKMQNAKDFAEKLSATLAKQTTYTPLPDRRESGVTYGAFSSTSGSDVMAAAGAATTATTPVTMQCTYDKTTYLMHVCTLQPPGAPFPMTLTYSAWNDPANTVDVPSDAPPGN